MNIKHALRAEYMPLISELSVKDLLPEREHKATEVSLFLYNAAIWNAHRIHYDERYAREVENHPGLLIDGPLQLSLIHI